MGVMSFLFIYCLGGITLLPLLVILIFLHAYLTLPVHNDETFSTTTDELLRRGDTEDAIKSGVGGLDEKFQPRRSQDADVAAGYFAVCREYVPGGVNGKPPERTTPAGSTVISSPSPSVYQSMYRSIFDRKPTASPLENKGVGKPQNKGGNVFYVVLRHSHLLLFDDESMIEVRYVLSLAHHDVSIYGGGEFIPEGELFIKRNALCLTRKNDAGELTADGTASKPFFLFAENTSEKEDFYFAMLKSQDRTPDAMNNPPIPLQFDVKDMISLVQRLHSSEEHMQTRWINALLGRIFLSLYKTSDVENFIRSKITKKISRVKKPSFLSGVVLRHVDMGEGAPYITNPRLKDLTVDGDCILEADIRYTGNFRLEIAATARIDLGTRFKAREVNLLLAVVVKKVEGHVFLKVKPPPSNRIWLSFATAPKIEMTIEPIVSSRQITYTLILRQIESRIKEVIAESIVMPFWDDVSFFPTKGKRWRGGIWVDDTRRSSPPDLETVAAEEGDVDEVEHLESATEVLPSNDSSVSVLSTETTPVLAPYARKNTRSLFNLGHPKATASSSSVDTKSIGSDKPKAIRHGSFTSSSSPIVSMEFTNADGLKPATPSTASATAALSASSNHGSPVHTPVGSPSLPSVFRGKSGSHSSASSFELKPPFNTLEEDLTPQPTFDSPFNATTALSPSDDPPSPTSTNGTSFKPDSLKSFQSLSRRHDSTTSSLFSGDVQEQSKDSGPAGSSASSLRSRATWASVNSNNGQDLDVPPKRITLTAVANAAANARRWGINALHRSADQNKDIAAANIDTPSHANQPMGRGRPLPPPGVPLPPPDRKTPTAPIPVPKRKLVLPPMLPQRPSDFISPENSTESVNLPSDSDGTSRRASILSQVANPPPLPKRRTDHTTVNEHQDQNVNDDGLFVLAAPAADSEPTTPLNESKSNYLPPWVDDADDDDDGGPATLFPRLPLRRRMAVLTSEEDDKQLPSWMAAQEEESRAKSLWIDEDAGHDH